MAKAAAANITGVLLELGGKSAHLVFGDADLDAACNGVLAGVFAATGQTCMAGSRLLVAREVHDALVGRIAERARSIRLGDPKAAETEMGPVSTEPQYRKVLSFLDGAAAEGATVAAGGRPDERLGGYFVQPTVLTGVKPSGSSSPAAPGIRSPWAEVTRSRHGEPRSVRYKKPSAIGDRGAIVHEQEVVPEDSEAVLPLDAHRPCGRVGG